MDVLKYLNSKGIKDNPRIIDVSGQATDFYLEDLLKDYKEQLHIQQRKQLNKNKIPTFDAWITQDIKRMEIYATFLDDISSGSLGNLYREYINDML